MARAAQAASEWGRTQMACRGLQPHRRSYEEVSHNAAAALREHHDDLRRHGIAYELEADNDPDDVPWVDKEPFPPWTGDIPRARPAGGVGLRLLHCGQLCQ
jgi:hypothetical protein